MRPGEFHKDEDDTAEFVRVGQRSSEARFKMSRLSDTKKGRPGGRPFCEFVRRRIGIPATS